MRPVSVPFKLSVIMALVTCVFLAVLGLSCGSAYADARSDGDETPGSTSLVAGSVDGFTQMTAASKSTTYNVGSGSCTCADPDTEYTIVGTSEKGTTVTIKGGDSEAHAVHVTLDNVTIDHGSVKPSSAPITVESGYAVVKLRGTNVLRAGYKDESFAHDWGFAGLCVPSGATCIITSADGDGSTNGSLEAHGGHNKYGGAGIGTNYNKDTGAIYIKGGTIKAYGAHCAAGIGSGRDGQCYTMCIEGGDVWAWGGEYAAGIGGGDAVGTGKGGTTHDLWVHGGTVHAYGGDNGGAGIGGSEGGSTDKITITGGNITAYGCGENGSKGSAAGIGSGDGKECGTIEIKEESALTIDAKGCGEGAGIGGANCQSGTINITLNGGAITATGGPEAAGIGGGGKPSGTINIKGNGTVNAQAGAQSAAIGAGNQKHSGPINIKGSNSRLNINAYAPKPEKSGENFVSYAAIIGAGDGSASDISINNANINLHGSSGATIEGAGIGTGSSNDLSMSDDGINNIAISNATIRFNSIYKMNGAGIGAGYGSNIKKTIKLDNVDYEGPTIGSSCSDRYLTDENSMDSISISNSKIKAIARGDDKRNHAGIGTGPYGTINSITIANSDVEAKGVYGAAGIGSGGMYVNPSQVLHLASVDGKCGSVTISGRSKVKAIGSEGGAGIGSGTLTSVKGTISITSGATVEAVGGNDGGAGIGGGKLCSCKDIVIDGATVRATGGPAAAGIGSGGVDDTTFISGVIQTAWNSTCGNVTISGKSDVKAIGGSGAAGIGLGQGAQMESNCWITISGGTVVATGGLRGAGIGAGRQSGWNRGAEARRIKIEGESKVTATGGAGAAGIGGGYEGGLEKCQIALSVNDPKRAFVKAYGGLGAAGIGAGASSKMSANKGTMDGAHDAKSLSFSGGFIAAYGGNGKEGAEESEGRTGPGAGIGGGSFQGDLEGCMISGGVVIAHAGANESGGPSGAVPAEDIGHGGCRGGDNVGGDGSDSIYIYGGTVIGEVNQNERVLVVGGSVKCQLAFNKATSSNFELKPVYQNAIAIDTSSIGLPFVFDGMEFYSLGLESTSSEAFRCNDVFAIATDEDRATAYLYLPAGAENATTAFVKPDAFATLGYYGTTYENERPNYAEGKNVLKMGAPIAIAPKRRSDALIEYEPYIVRVADLSGDLTSNDTACYTSITNAELSGYYAEDGQLKPIKEGKTAIPIYTTYSTGTTYTDVEVMPGAAGDKMIITAKLNRASGASDLYWDNGEAIFKKEITEAPPSVKITNADELSKVYDGQPAIDPIYVTSPAECAITKIRCLGQWGTVYDETVNSPDVHTYMPTGIGYYEVTVWAKYKGHTVTDSASFKIVDPNAPKQSTSLTVTDPSKTYDMQPVSPSVQCTSDGNVTLLYKKQNGDGTYGEAFADPPSDVGDYIVIASVPMTVTYEAANTESPFAITPKEGSLTLAAIGDGTTGEATVTARLSGVYDNVVGKDIAFTLDNGNETATAQLSAEEDGTFTATCTFNGVGQGSHRVSASFADSNYQVEDATTTFDIPAPQSTLKVEILDELDKVYDGVAVSNPAVEVTKNGVPVTSQEGLTVAYSYSTSSGLAPKNPGVYFVTATATVDDLSASDTRLFLIFKCPVVLSIEVADKVYDGQPVTATATAQAQTVGTTDQPITYSYYKKQADGSKGDKLESAPIDAGSYIVTADAAATSLYKAGCGEASFAITPKPATLTLAAYADGSAEKAALTASLSGVFGDVEGSYVEILLDGEHEVARLASAHDGVFSAACTFDGVKPGRHVATAGYSNPNYLVDDAMTAFEIEVPLPAVSVTITEDPTKYYDGVAVKNPAAKVIEDGEDVTDHAGVTVAYSYSTSSGLAPTNPGVYLVTATATVDGVSASDTRLFLIRKCPVEISIEISDKAYDGDPVSPVVNVKAENGLVIDPNVTLTYYEDQGNGTYGEAFTDPPSASGSYYAKAERPGDAHYRAAEASATFTIGDKPAPFLFVDMPARLVYNAQPVKYPIVWVPEGLSSDDVEITYYDADGKKLTGEPMEAGNYSVEVRTLATEKYRAVSSDSIRFTILPHPAVLAITADGDQSTESAEVAVTLKGALSDVVDKGKSISIDVAYDEPDAVSAQSADDTHLAAQASTSVQAQIKSVGESFIATHRFPHVGAGEYMVTASYSDDPNYLVKDKEERFDKSKRAYRVSAEDETVTFGDAPFAVKAEVRDSNGAEVANPTLSYSQVSSEDLPMVDEDSAVLGEGGMVSVRNAGISAIRVDVAGDDTHDGDYDYAVITVEKAPLPLTVAAKDKVADGKPAEVAYFVDDAAYSAPYSGYVTLTYFRENAGVRTRLEAAPTESGSYVVVATAAGDRNYNAGVAEASFKIQASGDSDTKPTPGNDSDGKNGGTNGPRTGDNTAIWPLVVFAAFGFVALACSARRMRENGQRDNDEGQTG